MAYLDSVLTSTNGIDWTRRLLPYSVSAINGVTFLNGRFYLLSSPMLSSTNAVDWTQQSVPQAPSALAYGNGRYVMACAGIWVSSDGATWALALPNKTPSDIAFGAGVFVATAVEVLWSQDGLSWVYASLVPHQDVHYYSVGFGEGVFLAASFSGVIKSTNGNDWVPLPAIAMYSTWPDSSKPRVRFGLSTFAVCNGTNVWTSRDSVNWTRTVPDRYYRNDLAFSGSTCYTVGTSPFHESNPLVTRTDPPTYLNISLYPGIEVVGQLGARYRIECAETLQGSAWVSVTELYLRTYPTLWIDPSPSAGKRYYRAVRVE
jgi:hypothetical protein